MLLICKCPYSAFHVHFMVFLQGSRQCDQEIKHIKKKKKYNSELKRILFPLLYAVREVKVKFAQTCPTLCESMEFSRPESWSGQPFPSPGDLPTPGIKPRSPTLQADSLPAEPPGKPKNTRVGSLSLLQRIFLTQESSQGLLHCRWILY